MNATTKIVSLERACKVCTVLLPVSDFHFYGTDRPSWTCKACHVESERKRQKALWASDPAYRERHNAAGKAYRRGERIEKVSPHTPGNERDCKVCGKIKPFTSFTLNSSGHRLKTCEPCYKEAENLKARIRYREDPENYARRRESGRRAFLKCKYGITPQHAAQALASQFGRCANRGCGLEISFDAPKASGKRAVVDHCHRTRRFRAILCDGCNLFLGRIEKSENRHLGLLEYVQKHKA